MAQETIKALVAKWRAERDRMREAIVDNFKGDTAHLVDCINALLAFDAEGALVPNGLGGPHSHASILLSSAAARLRACAIDPIAPAKGAEGWETIIEKLDDDSLDAIMEVVGSPKLYNDGKSAMRKWFLDRLRALAAAPSHEGKREEQA